MPAWRRLRIDAIALLYIGNAAEVGPHGSGGADEFVLETADLAGIADLTALIEPEARALGFELVRVKLFGGAGDVTLQVMAERRTTRQLTIDDCAALSRRISDRFDALEAEGRDPMDSAYRLEVSSPGIDRPLTRLADYQDWKGHEARLHLAEPIEGRKQLTGVLAGVEDGAIAIDVKKHKLMTVTLDQIADAKLLITDKLIAATAPLSTEGADEFETAPPSADENEDED